MVFGKEVAYSDKLRLSGPLHENASSSKIPSTSFHHMVVLLELFFGCGYGNGTTNVGLVIWQLFERLSDVCVL